VTVLRLRLESVAPSLPVASLTDVLDNIRRLLQDLDRALSGRPSGVIQWHVSDLGMNSPITADLQAVLPTEFDPLLGRLVSTNLIAGLRAIEHGDGLPPYFSDVGLKAVRRITDRIREDGLVAIDATYLDGEHRSVRLTEAAGRHVEQLTEPHFQAIGSVTGTLDTVSLRGVQRFNVYDSRTERAVRCRFPPEDFEVVRAALGRRVRVAGVVHRNFHGDAVAIDMPTVEVLPLESQGPSTADITGIAPDFTGDMSVGEYLQRLRDA
jgi:hypothetical protein